MTPDRMADAASLNRPSAFPVNAANLGGPGAYAADPGMDLRDWFAGRALSGIVATMESVGGFSREERDEAYLEAATECYHFADAMFATRSL